MTREEAIKKHRELWHWIANETIRRKTMYVRKYENPDVAKEMPNNGCWLCEYVRSIGGCCGECPIDWGSTKCTGLTSPYRTWAYCHILDYKERANLADIIAELPEKEE